ncbi:MAG: hypothetical protein Q8R47_03165 [Nanoarchaeota archaeon]|nr:hypothetical protein [Nanoarchaeota archaeon]
MMKKSVVSLALLASACTTMHRVPLGNQDAGQILYRQTSSSSKSYGIEVCLDVKNPLLYSVADGVTVVHNFARSILVPGYVMEARDSRFDFTQNGWILCNDYLYEKRNDHYFYGKR